MFLKKELKIIFAWFMIGMYHKYKLFHLIDIHVCIDKNRLNEQ